MVRFLIRKYIKNYENTQDRTVRAAYGTLAGVLGMVCNFLLFGIKLFAGIVTGSIAVTSDAFNNLSDMGASVVSVISAKLSNQRPDADHPYGHGRYEYIASLFVAAMILMVGIELLKSSVDKIRNPTEVHLAILPLILLCVSVAIKVWMFFFNRYIGREIDAPVLRATAADSLNDAISTGAVIITTVIGTFLPFAIDGYVGIFVCLLIFKAGLGIMKETIDLLLGRAPDKELVARIGEIVTSGEGIIGIHDLIVNDYGPGRCIASVHAEIPAKANIIRAHEIIDALEMRISEELGVIMVIHMDPVITDDPHINALREWVTAAVSGVDESYTMHDFRITEGEERINLIFDVAVPVGTPEKKITADLDVLKKAIRAKDSRYAAVIAVDTYVP